MKRITFNKIMKLLALSGFLSIEAYAGNLQLEGGSFPPISITPSKDTGLDFLYVVHDIDGCVLKYTSNAPDNVKISTFSSLGAAYLTPVESVSVDNNSVTIDRIIPNSGYVIEDGEKQFYFWIINYSDYEYDVSKITPNDDDFCNATILEISGNARPIVYYSINGRQETLSRDIKLVYNTLTYDINDHQFIQSETVKNIASISEKITIIPPVYCSTDFILEGDRFLKEWDKTKTTELNDFVPKATLVETEAVTDNQTGKSTSGSNQINSNIEGLGGSAPYPISFKAYVSDAVIHNEWQMANDELFEDITYRVNEQDFDYTFTHEGVTYIRFIGSNSDGSCEAIGETYTVSIGESELLIPNAFSPNNDGINDEWKVSYRSLIEFKCWIFDRQGHEILFFDNPENGWDGKRDGKYVSPGVYYYVIQALGSDGKHYKKSGDINIIKSSSNKQQQNY